MRKITVFNSLTLDGVMQAPGHPDEDRRGGFEHGGWAVPYADDVMLEFAAKGMQSEHALLFGRRTYEQFHSYWPHQTENPYTEVLDKTDKYVASKTLAEPLPWQNSILLRGEAAITVARLKDDPGPEILILGSGELVRSLMTRGLIDEFMLSIHPLVLGSGQRLFSEEHRLALQLVDTVSTTTGVIIATYRPGHPE